MKIKSVTDVVTNSSSECFLIITNDSEEAVKNKWLDFIEKNNLYFYWDGVKQTTGISDGFDCTKIAPEVIKLDYPVLCNVDDCFENLEKCFGEGNVVESC